MISSSLVRAMTPGPSTMIALRASLEMFSGSTSPEDTASLSLRHIMTLMEALPLLKLSVKLLGIRLPYIDGALLMALIPLLDYPSCLTGPAL